MSEWIAKNDVGKGSLDEGGLKDKTGTSPPIDIRIRTSSVASVDSDDQPPVVKTPPSTYYAGSMAPASLPKASTTKQLMLKRAALTASASRLVIVLVGLPGRGKSFIARKLELFLNWMGARCKVFNVGRYRRHLEGSANADFFSSSNKDAASAREKVASLALADMFTWLEEPMTRLGEVEDWAGVQDSVAVFDATNSTRKRREKIKAACNARKRHPVGLVFVESVCDDEGLLEDNFRLKVRNSPDFEGMTEEEAMRDLKDRVKNYEMVYETLDDDDSSYIKVYNLSSKIMANNIFGRTSKTIIPCLMAWNIGTRPIWLCRAGETEECSVKGRSRDAHLSERGAELRDKLGVFVRERSMRWKKEVDGQGDYMPSMGMVDENDTKPSSSDKKLGKKFSNFHGVRLGSGVAVVEGSDAAPCKIISSTMPRAYETANYESSCWVEQSSHLNPLDKGDFTGMEMGGIKKEHPEWYKKLEKDPFRTRFPGGESYEDLVKRLESVIIDFEQQIVPVLVVSHVSVLQCLVAYFRGSPIDKCTEIAFPMDTVVEMKPVKGGMWQESRFSLISPRSRMSTLDDASVASAMSGNSLNMDDLEEALGQTEHPIWEDPAHTVEGRRALGGFAEV
eukprot:CAMPEP_0118649680 /NCGR_PEP_ID=MMETSP0785-20121206/9831_1 /TAXON_ID=91992 /ORGANISM="Bolidomonas pacifica, Strain CCMP 1866" /LENGTH=620 /DNA_ID=CAMNT_0006541981 /DNA_START=467 /DNA_END=2325 /DNA_ORIENTATION=+